VVEGAATAGSLGAMFAGAIMGIYDREYYRGETHGSGWLTGLAPATKAIIVINVVVFFLEPILQQRELGSRDSGPISSPAATTSSGMGTSGNC
jgi:hypothetical protein